MSYIRCTSNPEGLYIWCGDELNITRGCDYHETMPVDIFEGILEKWHYAFHEHGFEISDNEDESEYVEYKGAKLVEKKVTEGFKWVLEYKDIELPMWETTLYYMTDLNKMRWKKERGKREGD